MQVLLTVTLFNVAMAEVMWGETSRDKLLSAAEVNAKYGTNSCMPCLYNGLHWCPGDTKIGGGCVEREQVLADGVKIFEWKNGKCTNPKTKATTKAK